MQRNEESRRIMSAPLTYDDELPGVEGEALRGVAGGVRGVIRIAETTVMLRG